MVNIKTGFANFLREEIEKRFLGETPHAELKKTGSKNAYLSLMEHIYDCVPEARKNQSASHKRLCKLFFYTDARYCKNSRSLQKMNFGEDFLDACCRYISDNRYSWNDFSLQSNPEDILKGKGVKIPDHIPVFRPEPGEVSFKAFLKGVVIWLAGLILGIMIGKPLWGGSTDYLEKTRTQPFSDNMDEVSDEALYAKGWLIADKDESEWQRFAKSGHLALSTLRGDNWVNNYQPEAKIINMVYRKLDCDCCTVTARLTDFDPMKNWQQAGLMFLEEPDFSGRSMRMTFAVHQEENGRPRKKLQILPMQESRIPYNKTVMTLNEEMDLSQISLQIRKDGDQFEFLYYLEGSFSSYYTVVRIDFRMTPGYVALVAFQGFVEEDGRPVSADTIPAYFDYFRVDTCRY